MFDFWARCFITSLSKILPFTQFLFTESTTIQLFHTPAFTSSIFSWVKGRQVEGVLGRAERILLHLLTITSLLKTVSENMYPSTPSYSLVIDTHSRFISVNEPVHLPTHSPTPLSPFPIPPTFSTLPTYLLLLYINAFIFCSRRTFACFYFI